MQANMAGAITSCSRLADVRSLGLFSSLIGLTGGMASGKSSALAYLHSLGAVVVQADTLAHSAYKKEGGPAYDGVVQAFGPGVVHPITGEIDRPSLATRVFSDPSHLATLNGLVWPATELLVARELQAQAEKAGCTHANPCIGVVEAALLLEAGWHESMDEVWVTIPGTGEEGEREAVRRAVARSGGGMTEEAARKRIASQMAQDTRLSHPSVRVIINTSGPVQDTQARLKGAWEGLLGRLGKGKA